MPYLQVHRQDREGTVVLSLVGELDISSSPDLERALTQAEGDAPATVVLDLSGLTFMDSSGLRAVLEADQRARADGRRLAVVPGPPAVRRVFTVTLLDRRLDLIETADDAG